MVSSHPVRHLWRLSATLSKSRYLVTVQCGRDQSQVLPEEAGLPWLLSAKVLNMNVDDEYGSVHWQTATDLESSRTEHDSDPFATFDVQVSYWQSESFGTVVVFIYFRKRTFLIVCILILF